MKVHIACPKTVPQDTLIAYVRLIRAWGADVSYWVRGEYYSDKDLKDADAVVVLLPDNAWKMPMSVIPRGTKCEIELAKRLKKPLYLGYLTDVGTRNVYRANMDFFDVQFSGTAGTYEELPTKLHDANQKSAKEVIDSAKAIADAKMTVTYQVIDVGALAQQTYGGRDKRLLFRLRK